MSGFIGYFAFSGKQFTLVQAIPSSPSPTKVKIPLLWSQTREVCLSSPSGFSADLFASLLVMDIQFTWFSIQKWNIFFHFPLESGWETHLLVSWPQHCSELGAGGRHLLGLKAADCGRCFGSAQGWRCWEWHLEKHRNFLPAEADLIASKMLEEEFPSSPEKILWGFFGAHSCWTWARLEGKKKEFSCHALFLQENTLFVVKQLYFINLT